MSTGHLAWRTTSSVTLPRRNLYESLNYVNPQQPGNSELLVKSTSPHGGADAPVLDERDTESLQLLAAWVHRVSQGKPPVQPTAIRSSQDLLLQPNDALADGKQPRPHSAHEAAATPAGEVRQPGNLAAPSDSSAVADHAAGRDPFDPEVFNQRYLKRGQQPTPGG